ncbi:cation diffusion facilitator family transporter [Fundidesulfovibrio putealis]|uniref:cation diffusion facilitator family transporter n=1 Tax=Fundidesulfovibrio putealis TaxID=270496 RepID=UPI00040FA61E|nr:cation diffusion facilitator family transporter [Fundidesulfovibrio putealis]
MLEIDRIQQKAIRVSFGLGILILFLKFAAYFITNSSALLSDALESIINVVASAFAMWSIHVAKTPPDADHPYGHGKVEYFSALLEGALIIMAAAGIVYAAFPKIMNPDVLQKLDFGLAVSVLASGLNFALGMYLVRQGRKTNSITLVADGKHVLADVYTTGGVLLGLVVVWISDWFWMDGAIACVVALNIVWTGYGLVRQAVKGLMNEADSALTTEITRLLNENRRPEWISIHKLRAWQAGRFVNIDFHLVLPKDISFERSQAIVNDLEELFRKHFGGVAEVLIKTDICFDDLCDGCAFEKCPEPNHNGKAVPWSEDALRADLHHKPSA